MGVVDPSDELSVPTPSPRHWQTCLNGMALALLLPHREAGARGESCPYVSLASGKQDSKSIGMFLGVPSQPRQLSR